MRTCDKQVSDHTGFHFRRCGREAKRYFISGTGEKVYRCGLHSREYRSALVPWVEVRVKESRE